MLYGILNFGKMQLLQFLKSQCVLYGRTFTFHAIFYVLCYIKFILNVAATNSDLSVQYMRIFMFFAIFYVLDHIKFRLTIAAKYLKKSERIMHRNFYVLCMHNNIYVLFGFLCFLVYSIEVKCSCYKFEKVSAFYA